MQIRVDDPEIGTEKHCALILRALPQWFGIEEATLHYIESIRTMPTVLAWIDDQLAGFLTIQHHSPYSAEIYVMAVYPQFHRHGVGKVLVHKAEAVLLKQGIRFFQVKTLSSKLADPDYARTRQFYDSLHFVPLEEFDDLWGESNPCLMLIKYLETAR